MYRAPGAKEWKTVDWEWALDEIAKKVKKTRDATFVAKSGIKVKEKVGTRRSRRRGGGGQPDDGDRPRRERRAGQRGVLLLQKFLRGLGLVAIEHQARI